LGRNNFFDALHGISWTFYDFDLIHMLPKIEKNFILRNRFFVMFTDSFVF